MAEQGSGERPGADPADELAPVQADGLSAVIAMRRTETDVRSFVGGLYDDHQREVFSFALHATRDQSAAEDIVQEAFARLVRSVRDGRVPDDPRAWLFRVAGNLVISRGRRAAVADRHRSSLVERGDDERSPERIALRRERRDAVEAALSGLAMDARTALLLAAQGFSGQEVAAAIGRSESATRTLLCRARSTLRELLADAGREP